MVNSQTFTLNIKALFDASAVKAKVGELQGAFNKLRLPDTLSKSLESNFTSLNKALSDFESRTAKGIKTSADAKGLTTSLDKVIKEFTALEGVINKVQSEIGNTVDLSSIIKFDDNTLKQLRDIENEISRIKGEIANINTGKLKEISTQLDRIKSGTKAKSGAESAIELFKQGDVDAALAALDKVIAKQEQAQKMAQTENAKATFGTSIEALSKIREQMVAAKTDAADLQKQLGEQTANAANLTKQSIDGIVQGVNEADQSVRSLREGAQGIVQPLADAAENQVRLNSELDQVKSRIQYFFGLANSINLVKRAIRSAFDTVKELDAAMTETAVVTDHTISDMWQKLPEYTKRANQLGVSTLAAYQSATLYYQQGLNDTQAGELSVETLKMARIAGLEAADATDRMTNALRGFNMELNTTSAQRVDDVYSQLAAMSASNVDEISTAMTKVASLAHSANMEFETTAAFLAQIIETTRESAETAGTALKTVAARFSEVKKLVDTDQLKGQDEEGQVVDVNKVSAALRTAGIDLNKYFLGEVGLDDIFMELASKWDSLTNVQQRYIATQAAGSRQQSRFIALMQDYARTQELVGAAYNAEGASARQFEKTQDSLQSKLARLKNAWNEFLMGITNSGVIKSVVDALTTLLNIINKLTGAFGPAASGFLKFGVAAAAVIGGKKAFSNGGIATKAIGALGNTPVGKFLGFGGNEVTGSGDKVAGALNVTAAKITTGSDEIAAAMHGAAAKIAGKGVEGTVGKTAEQVKKLTLSERFDAFQRDSDYYSARNSVDAWNNLYPGLMEEPKAPDLKTLGFFGKLGTKASQSKLFGGLSSKLAGGKVGAGLAKALGFGGSEAAIAAASGLAVSIGTIAAAAGAAAIAIKLMYDASPAGQLKQAKEYAKVISDTAASAQKTASNYKQVQANYKDYTDQIEAASSITSRQTAIQDRNDYIASLLESDPSYAQYISSTIAEDGQFILTLDENALSAAVDKVAESALQTTIASQMAQANVNTQQAQVYEARIASLQQQIAQREQDGFSTDKQRADLLYYQNQVASLNQSAQNQISASARQILANSGLDSELVNKLADAYASVYDSDDYQKAFDKYNSNAIGRLFNQEARKREYESIYGVGSAEGLNRKQIADALAGYRIQKEQKANLDAVSELISTGDYDQILEAIAGNIDFDEDDMTAANEKLQKFADVLGKNITELQDQIRQSQNARQEIKKTREGNIYERFLRSGAANERYSERTQGQEIPTTTAIDNYKAFLDTLDFEGTAAVEKITSQAESLLGDKLGEFMTELPDLYSTGQFSAVQKLFDNIDLNSPIQAFSQLQRYANDTTSTVGKYAAAIREANADLFTSSNLVQSFVTSADYEGITEQLSKFIEENEAITADNINELAESCSDLATLLDEDVASAQALAEAFTLLETGALIFDQITDALLKALDAGKGFETVIAEVKGWIEDFDSGNDLAEGADHVVSILEDLKGYVDNWEFGNEPVENIYDHLLGEGAYQDYLATFEDKFDPEKAEKDITAQIERFTKLFENEGLGAIQELTGKIPGLTSLGNNLFDWDLSAVGSTTDAINQVANALGITEQAAESLVLAWQTHIPGLRTEWNNLAFDEQVSAYANNLENAKVITEQELSALATATGHTIDEIKAKLGELAITDNINIPVIVNFQDADGKPLNGDTLYNKFLNTFGSWSNINHMQIDWGKELADTVIKDFEGNITGYDPSKVLSYFTERGLNTEQATEMANRAISEIEGKFTKTIEVPVTYKEEGKEIYKTETKEVVVEAKTVKGLDAAMNTAFQAANYESVASAIANQDFSGLSDKIAKAGESGGARAAASVKSQIEAQHPSIEVDVTYRPTNPEVLSRRRATGGIVGSYAKGSENFHVGAGTALTGEEGPELVWNKNEGYAYVTGQDGPEFADLRPGDRIFNASETKRIFKNSHATGGVIDSYASGGWKPSSDSNSPSGGSNSDSNSKDKGKKESTWRNELDWLYDLMEDIAEYERQQTIIQSKYELALNNLGKTGRDLFNLTRQELRNLNTQYKAQSDALLKRTQQMGELQTLVNSKGFQKYVQWNQKDQTLEINWDKIEAIQDKEKYDEVTEFINRMEEVQDQMDDAEKALYDIKKQIQELEERFLQQYLDFQKRVLDAVVKQYQTTIDNLSELNDTLNDANGSILDSLQKEIDLQRQIRDNTDTEQNIADMEARLAYLQRDTTGANAQEIRELEKQLSDARQDYSDTLIDQEIDRLNEANDTATTQREKQIELMQAQLDYWQESGGLWDEVADLIAGGFTNQGTIIGGSDLWEVLKQADSWEALSEAQKKNWANELILETNEVGAHLIQLSGGNAIDFEKVRDSIATNGDLAIKAINAGADTVRASIASLKGKMGGTPAHSYTAEKVEGYASGGTATSTAMALLHGTPQEPEYVLNARQTDAFLRLADILPAAMGGNTNTPSNVFGGDTIFNIGINVDSIASDYDVDQLVERIKDDLADAAGYRNVNALSFIR